MESIKYLLVAALVCCIGTVAAQNLIIEGLTLNDVDEHYCNPNCIIAPSNPANPLIISGNSHIQIRAGKCIELNPGFETKDLIGDAFAIARIGLQDFPVVILEATDVANAQIEQYEKIEFGIDLPLDIQDEIDKFLFGTDASGAINYLGVSPYTDEPYTIGINPYDPDQIKVDMTLKSPGGIERTIYGFYYEDFIRFYDAPDLNDGGASPCYEQPYDAKNWGKDRQLGNNRWRVRFSPGEQGSWAGEVTIELNGTLKNEYSCISFTCTNSPSGQGYVQVSANSSSESDRYLRWSDPKTDNSTFFSVSNNAVWANSLDISDNPDPSVHFYLGWKHTSLDTRTHLTYTNPAGTGWLQKMKENGINSVSIGMLYKNYSIEWGLDPTEADLNAQCFPPESGLGNYHARMRNAWEFDYLIESADDLDMQIIPMMEIHDHFIWAQVNEDGNGVQSLGKNHWWRNPYRGLTDIATPTDFFDVNKSAADYYEKKLRYMAARWGYSNNILFWELLSEVNNVDMGIDGNFDAVHRYHQNSSGVKPLVDDWFDKMADEFRSLLSPYREHYISGSFEQKEDLGERAQFCSIFVSSDVVSLHDYGKSQIGTGLGYDWVDYDNRIDKMEETRDFGCLDGANIVGLDYKPMFFDEGSDIRINLCYEENLKNTIWATSFMSCFGNLMPWYWDKLHDQNPDYYSTFYGLSQFIKQIDLADQNYHVEKWRNKSRRLEVIALVREDKKIAYGWVNNLSIKWDSRYPPFVVANTVNGCIEDLMDDPDLNYNFALPTAEGSLAITANEDKEFHIEGLVPKPGFNDAPNYWVKFYSTDDGTTLIGQKTNQETNNVGVLKVGLPFDLSSSLPNSAFIAIHEDIYNKSLGNNPTGKPGKGKIIESKLEMNIFPNPNNGQFTLEILNRSSEEKVQLEIYSLTGNGVLSNEYTDNSAHRIDISDLASGIYLIKIQIGDQLFVEKIIKE